MFVGRCARTESEVYPWDMEDDVDEEEAMEDIEATEDREDEDEGDTDAEELDNDVEDELEALARSMAGQGAVAVDTDDNGDVDGGSWKERDCILS